MTDTQLSEILAVDGGGLCYSVFPFPYVTGPGDVCISVHIQF